MIARTAEILIYLGKAATISEADLALLDMLHPLVEQSIFDYLGMDCEYAQQTEFLPAVGQSPADVSLDDYDLINGKVVAESRYSNSDRLQLKHTPVWSTGLQVWEDTIAYAGQASGAFASASLLTKGTDYYLDLEEDRGYSESGTLIRCSGTWHSEPRSTKVTYYGGWTSAQFDGDAKSLKFATIEAVAANFWTAKSLAKSGGVGAVTSETIGKYSATYDAAAAAVTSMLVELPPSTRSKLDRLQNFGGDFFGNG